MHSFKYVTKQTETLSLKKKKFSFFKKKKIG